MTEKPQARIGLQELYKARKNERVRLFVSPLKDLQGQEFKSFHVRHEASMLELFFDLFFVANLATFTAYHNVTSGGTVAAYIGFFLILWTTWFQITIFDVRFAADSVIERICKLLQFICFALFAVVGASFKPGTEESIKNFRTYQTMAITLGCTRFLLGFQYALAGAFVCRKYKTLILPFVLIVSTFFLSGTGLVATAAGFSANAKIASRVHILWWTILPIESIIIVTISSVWRMLSFKATHMNERLSLLTMIIIGEGVIGATKTVGYLWPIGYAPTWGNALALLSVVFLLMLMWQIYFDNHPHGDYGTIKQQWWALSHFFLHLGIVGTVEGSNRMAVIYYATKVWKEIYEQVQSLCDKPVSREKFVTRMNDTLQYLRIEKYDTLAHNLVGKYLNETLDPSKTPNYCALSSDLAPENEWSAAMWVQYYLRSGTFKRFNIVASAKDGTYYHTFKITYVYLWLSVGLLMSMLLIFLWIVRRKKHDAFEWVRMFSRLIIAIVALTFTAFSLVDRIFTTLINSPWLVGIICVLLAFALLIDRICRFLGVRYFRHKYAIPAPDEEAPKRNNLHNSMAFFGYRSNASPGTAYPGQAGHAMVPPATGPTADSRDIRATYLERNSAPRGRTNERNDSRGSDDSEGTRSTNSDKSETRG